MPPIKRWFPVSHDINSDTEVWNLTDKFGVSGLRAWLEILSIADRNDGVLPGLWSDYPRLLATRCKSTTRHLVGVCQFTTRWLHIDYQGTARVVNYSKYHRTREPNPFPPDLPDLPIRKTDKNQSQNSPSAGHSNQDKKKGEKDMGVSMNLSEELKIETDRLYYSDPVKFKRLAAWVAQGRKHGYSEPDMAEALREFWGYRAIDEWYPYLDTILTKVEKNRNRDGAVLEHELHEAEDKETARRFLGK